MSSGGECSHVVPNGDTRCLRCGQPQFCVEGKPHHYFYGWPYSTVRRCAICGKEEEIKNVKR